jgi:hypothetical protein
MKPVYISYVTEGTFYEEIVKGLVSSLEKFDLPYKIYKRPSLNDWDKNARQKSRVIAEALEEFSQPVVWLDADAIVQQYPILFDSLDCDMGCHVRSNKGFSIFSSTLYFGNTSMSKEIVNDWADRCERGEKELDVKIPLPYKRISTTWSFADQGPLANTYWTFVLAGKTVRLYELPKSYAVKSNSKHQERIIVQNQISREFTKRTAEWKNLRDQS